MRTTIIICVMALLAVLLCCTGADDSFTKAPFQVRWAFLGFWKEARLQEDTIKGYFFETDDGISMDTHAYVAVTDSGIWKFTVEKENNNIAAEPHPYYATFHFENDSIAYLQHENSWYIQLVGAHQLKLSDGHAKVFMDALIDETFMDTIIQASQGNLEIGPADTLLIHWDHGISAKWKGIDR